MIKWKAILALVCSARLFRCWAATRTDAKPRMWLVSNNPIRFANTRPMLLSIVAIVTTVEVAAIRAVSECAAVHRLIQSNKKCFRRRKWPSSLVSTKPRVVRLWLSCGRACCVLCRCGTGCGAAAN
jgi:hypothetical protein